MVIAKIPNSIIKVGISNIWVSYVNWLLDESIIKIK